MKETVISELQAYWEKLCFFWRKFADTARSVAADPGSVNKGDLILMCATLLIVALFVIGEIVR